MSDGQAYAGLNYGINTLGDASVLQRDERTYVVLGVSRGGTSAVAGLLNIFGVPMGRSGRAPLFEDLRMNRALGRSLSEAYDIVEENNRDAAVWGFKGNAIPLTDLDTVASKLRNPVFVVIFRDLLAIANRAKLSADRDIAWVLEKQAEQYSQIVQFIAAQEYYAVLLSFEKLNAYPEEVVNRFGPMTGLELTGSRKHRALEFIRPAPEDYLRVSTANKTQGQTD